jgi:cytoskeletal protein CcmA (bactofilin family)
MSDLDNKVMKGNDLGESFSDLMKKVVEKQLEEENAVFTEDLSDASQETFPGEEKAGPEAIIKSEDTAAAKPVEVPVFEWKEEEKPVVENFQPVSEVGVISTMTTINGTVSSKGHIRIEGNVIGDVFAYGDIKVTGKVAGDIEGGNVELGGCIVDGDVKARGDVTIGKDSSLTGNMNGQLITIDGKIKGNVEAQKGAHMSSTSLVKGSITAPTLSMSAGAELQGKVNVSKDDIVE